MTTADAFHNSELDFETWQQQKVNEGKMFFPENRTVQLLMADDVGIMNDKYSIKNIACEVVGGNEGDYNTGKDRFCNFLDKYAQDTITGMNLLIQDTICGDGSFSCDLGMIAVSAIAHQFRQTQIPAFCEEAFDAIWNDCGGKGGIGELWAAGEDGDGVEFGKFSAAFYYHDDGATCPADKPEEVCRVESF